MATYCGHSNAPAEYALKKRRKADDFTIKREAVNTRT